MGRKERAASQTSLSVSQSHAEKSKWKVFSHTRSAAIAYSNTQLSFREPLEFGGKIFAWKKSWLLWWKLSPVLSIQPKYISVSFIPFTCKLRWEISLAYVSMQVHTQVFEYSHTQVLRNDCAKDVNLEPQAITTEWVTRFSEVWEEVVLKVILYPIVLMKTVSFT